MIDKLEQEQLTTKLMESDLTWPYQLDPTYSWIDPTHVQPWQSSAVLETWLRKQVTVFGPPCRDRGTADTLSHARRRKIALTALIRTSAEKQRQRAVTFHIPGVWNDPVGECKPEIGHRQPMQYLFQPQLTRICILQWVPRNNISRTRCYQLQTDNWWLLQQTDGTFCNIAMATEIFWTKRNSMAKSDT